MINCFVVDFTILVINSVNTTGNNIVSHCFMKYGINSLNLV